MNENISQKKEKLWKNVTPEQYHHTIRSFSDKLLVTHRSTVQVKERKFKHDEILYKDMKPFQETIPSLNNNQVATDTSNQLKHKHKNRHYRKKIIKKKTRYTNRRNHVQNCSSMEANTAEVENNQTNNNRTSTSTKLEDLPKLGIINPSNHFLGEAETSSLSKGLKFLPQAIPISLRCRSTCCNHKACGRPIGLLHSRDSLAERIW